MEAPRVVPQSFKPGTSFRPLDGWTLSSPDRRGWIAEPEWARVRTLLPIACVDILPLKPAPHGSGWTHVGLILRDLWDVPGDGKKWCLVGGRIRVDETVRDAALRHVRETLGEDVRLRWDPALRPLLAEYLRAPRRGFGLDPRNHCVTPTYALRLEGTPVPRGEAADFRWFLPHRLPSKFGFRADLVIRKWLRLLATDKEG